MKEAVQSSIQDLSLYEKESLTQMSLKQKDSGKKSRKSKSQKKSKKSQAKEIPQPIVLNDNEPESENTRKELTQSRELQASQPTIVTVTPQKKTKLPRLKKKSKTTVETTPAIIFDASEPAAQEVKILPLVNNNVIPVIESKPKEISQSKKKTKRKKAIVSVSLPEENLSKISKEKKKKTSTKSKSQNINEDKDKNTRKRKQSRKRKTKKKTSKTLDNSESEDDSYYSDQFLFEMDEGSDYTCLTEADIVAEQSREIQEVSEVKFFLS